MSKSKAGLFLMELLISLLFFSFAGAICLQLFVGAHLQNERSTKLSHVSALLTNYSEIFYTSDDTFAGSDTIYYDSNLNLCNPDSASYAVYTYSSVQDNYLIENITINDYESNELLLDYDIKKYIRRTTHAQE